jgi:hypothetical protein
VCGVELLADEDNKDVTIKCIKKKDVTGTKTFEPINQKEPL